MNPDDVQGAESEDAELFPVEPRNWKAVQLFIRMQTQWRTGMSGIIGLDYAAIEAACRMSSLKVAKTEFEGLQIMEQAVLQALNEKNIG